MTQAIYESQFSMFSASATNTFGAIKEFNAMAAASRNSTAGPPGSPDFSVPWKWSDVILVVESQKFHVHRYTLAMW